MEQIKIFFEQLGFDFKQNLTSPKTAPIFEDENLNNKVSKNLFHYENKNQTNTSFYLLTTTLSVEDLDKVRNFIWNQNEADLLFVPVEPEDVNLFKVSGGNLEMYYAKTNPYSQSKPLYTFKISEREGEKFEELKKWRFDSGVFWLQYIETLKKLKTKSIDKELVAALDSLKSSLTIRITEIEQDEKKKTEIVQALIDRTLYIKYLEDNHIINSYFYQHYFKKPTLTYPELLRDHRIKDMNKLFVKINDIFSNNLFDTPKIEDKYLTGSVCDLLYDTLSGKNHKTGQLSLFSFKFDVIPVDLISYIYEVFLSKEQKENGIYYTPKKLAQLIVDDVIPEKQKGKVLDPSCGSGMFLSVALDKLIENTKPERERSVEREIEHRIRLLQNYIFGIEKLEVARRFTIFSLSLQIFRGLNAEKIKKYIAEQLEQQGEVTLFRDYQFHQNIRCSNSLSIKNPPFEGEVFEYIVGNPPFFEIKAGDEEISFLRDYKLDLLLAEEVSADYVVGNNQISQCFFIKIKDWAHGKTRFGFVSNSSNFYNDNSNKFQQFFYSSFGIEKIYELSKVKDILFAKAKESVVSIVFNNKPLKGATFEYYPVDMELFSEKPFELLIIKEDKALMLEQDDLIKRDVKLRDYLLGNEWDRKQISSLVLGPKLKEYLDEKILIKQGFQIWGSDARLKEYGIEEQEWAALDEQQQQQIYDSFIHKYFSNSKTAFHKVKYIKPANLSPFKITFSNTYISSIENFHRPREPFVYQGKKIIFSRLGDKLNCVFSKDSVYFDFDIYSVKLKDERLYTLFTAILNSDLVNYYLNLFLRKRMQSSFPKIGIEDMFQIPIPKNFDEDLVDQISDISKKLTDGEETYDGKVKAKLNELIYDLYDLSYTERQRIKDYFIVSKSIVPQTDQQVYKSALIDTIGMYLKNGLSEDDIEFSDRVSNIIVVKISLNGKKNSTPTAKVTAYKMLSEIFAPKNDANFLASQEKIWGKDCVYIIRKSESKDWTETKAYEDGQNILKRLIG